VSRLSNRNDFCFSDLSTAAVGAADGALEHAASRSAEAPTPAPWSIPRRLRPARDRADDERAGNGVACDFTVLDSPEAT
ncbi:hypothetical protein, partial [Terrimesophilobacter mesophilus]